MVSNRLKIENNFNIGNQSHVVNSIIVLGLARTGLIFTGIQEGAQPGGGG